MRVPCIFYLTSLAFCLVGCHQPMTTLKPPTFQSSEATVRDWKNAAHDVASELASMGLVPRGWPEPPSTGARPVFVEVLAPNSMFLREAADELQGDILRRGGMIANSPVHATVVSLDVDVVRWARDDFPSNTEAVLKAAVRLEDRLLMKLVEPVYVRQGDVALYQPPMHATLPERLLRFEQ
jgi:hypothetical protein